MQWEQKAAKALDLISCPLFCLVQHLAHAPHPRPLFTLHPGPSIFTPLLGYIYTHVTPNGIRFPFKRDTGCFSHLPSTLLAFVLVASHHRRVLLSVH